MADPLLEAIIAQANAQQEDATDVSPQATTAFRIMLAGGGGSDEDQSADLAKIAAEEQADRKARIAQLETSRDVIDKMIRDLPAMFATDTDASPWKRRLRAALGAPNSDQAIATARARAMYELMGRRNEIEQEIRLSSAPGPASQVLLKASAERWGKTQDETSRAGVAKLLGLTPGGLDYWTWVLKGELPKPEKRLEGLSSAASIGEKTEGVVGPETAKILTPAEEETAKAAGAAAKADRARKEAASTDKPELVDGLTPVQVDRAVDKNYRTLSQQAATSGGYAMTKIRRVEYDENGFPHEYEDLTPQLPPQIDTAVRDQAARVSPNIYQWMKANRPGWFTGATPSGESPIERVRRLIGERSGSQSGETKPTE